MDSSKLSWIANFIWGIADDVLRDLYVRGKYRDVILPMVVLRRLDAVLEPAKKAVLEMTADYGYGAAGAGGVIPPNASLNFEVELLGFN
jgi:type I restriction-modification system DNA methylase subunit